MRFERMNDHFVKLHLGDGTVYHHFTAADGPHSDFHDHGQWGFEAEILEGGYVEEILSVDYTGRLITPHRVERKTGDRFYIAHDHIHRMLRLTAPQCYTHVKPEPHRGTRENWYRIDGNTLHIRNGADEKWIEVEGWTVDPRDETVRNSVSIYQYRPHR